MADGDERNPETVAASASRGGKRGGRGKLLLIALALLVLIYALSPYYSFWRFTTALRAGDRNQLEKLVDFDSLRKSLKQQLRAKIAGSGANQPQGEKKNGLFGALSPEFGPRLIDTLVDAYVTPEGLAAFLANPRVAESPAAATAVASPAESAAPVDPAPDVAAPETVPSTEPGFRSINWSSVRYAFFTGPRDFAVDVQGTKLHYRFENFRWELKRVELDTAMEL
jgi:hypothetical protein